MSNNNKNYNRILIINLGGIGDVLLSLPALQALRKKYPQAYMAMLISERAKELADNFAFFEEVHEINIQYGGTMPLPKILRNIKTILMLRKRKFNLAVNMRSLVSAKSALKMRFLLSLIKADKTCGRDTEGRGHFYDLKTPETQIGRNYEMEYNAELMGLLNVNSLETAIAFAPDEKSTRKIETVLRVNQVNSSDLLIGIHPGGMPSRRWPVSNYAEVIKKINSSYKAKFVVTGTMQEQELVEELITLCGVNIINLTGRLLFKELAAAIKKCTVFVCNDTGPMHLAAVLKVPLVAIFGPGDIIRFDPRNIWEQAVVFYQKAECAPCEKVYCRSLKCLHRITSQDVYNAIIRVITRQHYV